MSEQEARDTTTSAERLEVLSQDPALRILVASNPVALETLLETLAKDPDACVRERVAGNPNTPWPMLEQLAWEFPQAFLHNPAGPLHLLAHLEQISTDEAFWDALLRVAAIPSEWWDWLRNRSVLRVHQTVRLHIQYAGETAHLYGVFQEADEYILLTLVEMLTAASAQGASLPPLTGDTFPSQSLTTGEQTARRYLLRLAQSVDSQVRERVARNPQAPVEVLQTLALDEVWFVRRDVAENPQRPVEVLAALAGDQHERVRGAIARHPRTPTEVLQTLARDASVITRWEVTRNPQLPGEILQTLAQDEASIVREAVASHPQTPVDVLRILALDRDNGTQRAVAQNPQTSLDVLQTFALAQQVSIRRAVARNPQTAGEILQILALDQDTHRLSNVRKFVASHSQTPEKSLRILARDKEYLVRLAVAENKRTPLEILQALAQDHEAGVRRGVAENLGTPLELLQALARDQYADVRRAVARHPRTPVETLSTLARDHDASVRVEVTRNGRTPQGVLQMLAQDHDVTVQRMASLVQKLVAGIERPLQEEQWWETVSQRLHLSSGWIGDASPEEQLGAMADLNVPEYVLQMIFAALAADWNATEIRTAFTEYDETDITYRLRARGNHYRSIMAPFMPAVALQKLAASPRWDIRYLVALHENTPRETRQRLSQDGNCYVRAMARAKAAQV